MNSKLGQLIDVLDLEDLDDCLFRGQNLALPPPNVYGGQVIAQALVAAARTVPSGAVHSLHAYFLRPGDWNRPILYEVDKVRDGRSFTSRYVRAMQHGEEILTMSASFQIAQDGYSHQSAMPVVPAPETLRELAEVEPKVFGPDAQPSMENWPIEIRPVPTPPAPYGNASWFRAQSLCSDDPLVHRAVLAYASDFDLLATALRPYGTRSTLFGKVRMASIDHAIWFHHDLRVDDWLLYAMDSPSAQGGRGLARGQIFDRSGRLVASTAQEGLIRPLVTPPAG